MMHLTAGAMILSDLILFMSIRRAVGCALMSLVLGSELYHSEAMFADHCELS